LALRLDSGLPFLPDWMSSSGTDTAGSELLMLLQVTRQAERRNNLAARYSLYSARLPGLSEFLYLAV
jgi:hypothetical protein